jgi:hypothetical protein
MDQHIVQDSDWNYDFIKTIIYIFIFTKKIDV